MQNISRACAAINVLDDYINGLPLEKALKKWFRDNRFAGSTDRRKIRDLVFDILRKRLLLYYPFQLYKYEENGRVLVLSYFFLYKRETFSLIDFENNKYFSPPINSNELIILNKIDKLVKKSPRQIALNYPSFLEKKLVNSLGHNFEKVMKTFLERAPVYLRVNQIKNNTNEVKSLLESENIFCENCTSSPNALKITSGEKFLKNSSCYQHGRVELQDLSSQLTTELKQISSGKKILDFCSGSGGKALAIASKLKNNADIFAYDINSFKLKILYQRSIKAGAKIKIVDSNELKKYRNFFDIVFVDAPCSGIGTWRRDPKNKWELNDQKLNILIKNQFEIIQQSSNYLKAYGFLIYVVCSFLEDEGDFIIQKFLVNNQNFSVVNVSFYNPINASDGFYSAILKKIN